MPDRIEGQIWIGRTQPNTLKYYAGGKEYWGVAATTYVAAEAISKGMIVAADVATNSTAERVILAQWPRDVERTLGIALNSAAPNETIRILGYGYVQLTMAEMQACFTTHSDINAGASLSATYYTAFGHPTVDGGLGNGWGDTLNVYNGRGANVYWFSGRTLKTAGPYSWIDPASHLGKLTIATPSGYKPTGVEIPWADDSLNVTYKNLPVIGNVVSYTVDGSNNITLLTLHVNFSKFQKKIQFEYPAANLGQFSTVGVAQELTLRHGLFANNNKPHVEISMWGYSDADIDTVADGEATRVWPGFDSYIGTSADKRTEVEVNSDTAFYYKVLGEVSYNN